MAKLMKRQTCGMGGSSRACLSKSCVSTSNQPFYTHTAIFVMLLTKDSANATTHAWHWKTWAFIYQNLTWTKRESQQRILDYTKTTRWKQSDRCSSQWHEKWSEGTTARSMARSPSKHCTHNSTASNKHIHVPHNHSQGSQTKTFSHEIGTWPDRSDQGPFRSKGGLVKHWSLRSTVLEAIKTCYRIKKEGCCSITTRS